MLALRSAIWKVQSEIPLEVDVKLILSCVILSVGLLAQEPPVRVSEEEAKKAVLTRVNPEYPPMAKQMHLAGKVQVDAYIDSDGNVDSVKIVNGNPLFTGAVTNAMKKWKFSPITANGKTVRAVAGFAFDFKL